VTPLQRLPAGAALEALPGVLPCLATRGRPSRARCALGGSSGAWRSRTGWP